MPVLHERILSRRARVAVIGLGYVGLPLAVALGEAGFTVAGYDLDPDKVAGLRQGRSHIADIPASAVAALLAESRFHPSDDPDILHGVEIAIICVPTPLSLGKQPDLGFVLAAAQHVAAYLQRGTLVVLESTTYPGTTEDVLRPVLERGGLKVGKDFFLAFSPERVDPGNAKFNLKNTPRVVGGCDPESARLAALLYEQVAPCVHVVSSARVAEMAKLLENTFRHVNIALANEMAVLCRAMGIDIWEVVEAAATKPYGFMAFYPGPGVGGHCIPIDPHYFSWKVREYDRHARFIELAAEINDRMPRRVADLVTDALNDRRKAVRGAQVLVLGVAYKKDVADARESPALKVMELLLKKGAEVRYHDPHLPSVVCNGATLHSVPLTREELERSDCVLVLTDHSALDYGMVAACSTLVVDTRNALKGIKSDRIVRL